MILAEGIIPSLNTNVTRLFGISELICEEYPTRFSNLSEFFPRNTQVG